MGLETGVTYIDDLVATNPVGATDNVDEGDDHIRNIKKAVKGSFPSLGNTAVTKTAAEVNDLATVTGTETLTNKTLTSPTITTPSVTDTTIGGTSVFNGAVSGTMVNDEDDMVSNSATRLATQQSIKAYVDALTATLGALALLDTVGSVQIDADAVTFASEMTDVTTNYDESFNDTVTQTIDAGIYNYGKDMPTSGTMNGTLNLQVRVDAAWYNVFTATVTNGAATIPTGQITSNGADVRIEFTYSSGAKSTITFRMSKIFL